MKFFLINGLKLKFDISLSNIVIETIRVPHMLLWSHYYVTFYLTQELCYYILLYYSRHWHFLACIKNFNLHQLHVTDFTAMRFHYDFIHYSKYYLLLTKKRDYTLFGNDTQMIDLFMRWVSHIILDIKRCLISKYYF